MDIGISIQTNRKRLGLSQEELGQQLCVSRQTVSQWENGQTMPSVDNLLRLKEIFGISLDCLLGEKTAEEPTQHPEETFSISLSQNDLKEICHFAYRPLLHSAIIRSVIVIALLLVATVGSQGELAATLSFIAVCIISAFWIQYFKSRKQSLRSMVNLLADRHRTYLLYAEYFEMLTYRNNEQVSYSKDYYKDIAKIQQTDHYVLLQMKEGTFILPKEVLHENSRINDYMQTNPGKKAPGANVVLWKTASLILFIASLAALFGAIGVMALVSQYNNLPFRNMWVFFLFLPVPIASIFFGIIAKRKGYPQKKNIIVGIIMAIVLTLYGCFTFIFSGIFSEDPIGVERVEYYMDIDVPEYDQISTQIMGKGSDPTSESYKWYASYIYFETDDSRNLMEQIQKDARFTIGIPSELRGLTSTGVYVGEDQYILFYNVDTGQYNEYPPKSGIYRIIMVAFDDDANCMHITEYNINYIAN